MIIEYTGVVAFSIAGVIFAMQKKNDMVGIVVYALLTAFGGSFIHELPILGANKINESKGATI